MGDMSVLFVNVYFPANVKNITAQLEYVGKSASLYESKSPTDICILGDYMAAAGYYIFQAINTMYLHKDLTVINVPRLSPNCFTHINQGFL